MSAVYSFGILSGFGLRLWEELAPSILWAVPKKKTSHSKKRMRASNKGLDDKLSELVSCKQIHF
jgi:hypothetical protein